MYALLRGRIKIITTCNPTQQKVIGLRENTPKLLQKREASKIFFLYLHTDPPLAGAISLRGVVFRTK